MSGQLCRLRSEASAGLQQVHGGFAVNRSQAGLSPGPLPCARDLLNGFGVEKGFHPLKPNPFKPQPHAILCITLSCNARMHHPRWFLSLLLGVED